MSEEQEERWDSSDELHAQYLRGEVDVYGTPLVTDKQDVEDFERLQRSWPQADTKEVKEVWVLQFAHSENEWEDERDMWAFSSLMAADAKRQELQEKIDASGTDLETWVINGPTCVVVDPEVLDTPMERWENEGDDEEEDDEEDDTDG